MNVLELLRRGDFETALDSFDGKEWHEKLSIFKRVSLEFSSPSYIALLQRRLSPNLGFEAFYEAWKPGVSSCEIDSMRRGYNYYDMPVRVLNCENIADPSEVYSIGLVYADSFEKLMASGKARGEADAARGEAIAEVSEKLAENKMCRVRSDDMLGE